MEIRRIQFDQGFLDAVRANMKPANQLQVLRTPQWDLAVASERRDAVEALISLFCGLAMRLILDREVHYLHERLDGDTI
jgi:hypothetical protein